MVTVSDDNSMQRDSSRETFPVTKAIYYFYCWNGSTAFTAETSSKKGNE